MGLTVTVGLVGAVLAVSLAVTPQTQVHTLAPCAGELGSRAHRAAQLVTLVVTLGEAVTAPGPGDAVDLPSGTRKLVGGAGGRLWGEKGRPSHRVRPGDQETAQVGTSHVPKVLGGAPCPPVSISCLLPQPRPKAREDTVLLEPSLPCGGGRTMTQAATKPRTAGRQPCLLGRAIPHPQWSPHRAPEGLHWSAHQLGST